MQEEKTTLHQFKSWSIYKTPFYIFSFEFQIHISLNILTVYALMILFYY